MKTSKITGLLRFLWVAATTCAITLSVDAQPRFTTLTWVTDGTMRVYSITAEVTTGMHHRLEASTDLGVNSWIEVGGATASGPSLTLNITNAIVADPRYRFFRLIAESSTAAPVDMALIPADSFDMGDAFGDGDGSERPVHSVFVSAFYMDKTEVTKALWDEVKGWNGGNGYTFDNPGLGKAANHPVQRVSWYDGVKWCNGRSQKEGRVPAYYSDAALTQVYKTGRVEPYVKWNAGYRLPTEAEWEKAARYGASGHRFPWSDADTITHSRASYYSLSDSSYDISPTRGYHPKYAVGGQPYTSPVGSFAANEYGLYDMAGNVWEWCWDWYGSYSSGSQADPRGRASGSSRVIRGGGWNGSAINCRSAYRGSSYPGDRDVSLGFRSALPPGQP